MIPKMSCWFASLRDNLKNFAILKLAVNPQNPELVDLYKAHVEKHNASIVTDPFPNAGFDLFVPDNVEVPNTSSSKMISMDVKCEMVDTDKYPSAFFMFPRSSISKTPLSLANHTGIIDSGYRGNLIGAFRNLSLVSSFLVEKHTRLLQICHPSLCPIHVIMVDEADLSKTARGEGGFGSTGI